MTKTYDFDAWYDEHQAPEKPTRPFRFGGRLWQIPVDPPAAPLLRLERGFRQLADLDDSDVVPADLRQAMDNERLLVDLIGQEMFDEWAALASRDRLSAVAVRLFWHYIGADPLDPPDTSVGEDAEGKPAAPTTDATSSDGSSTTGL